MKINLVTILKGGTDLIFGKIIGLDSIPKEKREEVREKALAAATQIVKAAAEGAAAGAVEGAKNR